MRLIKGDPSLRLFFANDSLSVTLKTEGAYSLVQQDFAVLAFGAERGTETTNSH